MSEKSLSERMAVLETQRLNDKLVYETRVSHLEHELETLQKKFDALKTMLTKIALKWGGFGIAVMALGAGLSMSADKIREIVSKLFLWNIH